MTAQGTALADIGCGAGGAAAMAAERSARVAGIDASAEMIEIARSRTPSGDFRVGDMLQLPWADRSFDVVTLFNSLEFAASHVDALHEAGRVPLRTLIESAGLHMVARRDVTCAWTYSDAEVAARALMAGATGRQRHRGIG